MSDRPQAPKDEEEIWCRLRRSHRPAVQLTAVRTRVRVARLTETNTMILAATPGKIASRPNGGRVNRLHQTHTTSPVSIDASAPAADPCAQFKPMATGARKKRATNFGLNRTTNL